MQPQSNMTRSLWPVVEACGGLCILMCKPIMMDSFVSVVQATAVDMPGPDYAIIMTQ